MTTLIDAFLLNRFERFAHSSQRLVGLNNFTLARLCYVLGFTSYFRLGWPTALVGALVCLMTLSGSYPLESVTRQCAVRGIKSPMTQPGGLFGTIRVLTLVCTLPIIIAARIGPLMWFGLVSYVYFSSCTPLPPGVSRVKAFWRSLARVRFRTPLPASG